MVAKSKKKPSDAKPKKPTRPEGLSTLVCTEKDNHRDYLSMVQCTGRPEIQIYDKWCVEVDCVNGFGSNAYNSLDYESRLKLHIAFRSRPFNLLSNHIAVFLGNSSIWYSDYNNREDQIFVANALSQIQYKLLPIDEVDSEEEDSFSERLKLELESLGIDIYETSKYRSKVPTPRIDVKTGSRFFVWLMKQRIEDTPIGDLACDSSQDSEFPKNENMYEPIKKYLINADACSGAIDALEEAFQEFKNKKQARYPISNSLRVEILQRDNLRCVYCGHSPKSNGTTLEIDHIHPVSKGGSNKPDNLQTLCFECNRGKSARVI
jgi:uncharacterized protein YozE (UPF0346 family)